MVGSLASNSSTKPGSPADPEIHTGINSQHIPSVTYSFLQVLKLFWELSRRSGFMSRDPGFPPKADDGAAPGYTRYNFGSDGFHSGPGGPPFLVIAVRESQSEYEGDLQFPTGQIITVLSEEDHRFSYYGTYTDEGVRKEGVFLRSLVRRPGLGEDRGGDIEKRDDCEKSWSYCCDDPSGGASDKAWECQSVAGWVEPILDDGSGDRRDTWVVVPNSNPSFTHHIDELGTPVRLLTDSSYRTVVSTTASSVSCLTAPPASGGPSRVRLLPRSAGNLLRAAVKLPCRKLVHERGLGDLRGWSGRGQHVKFCRFGKPPLKVRSVIGHTAVSLVEEVVCRRIRLARKSITCSPRLTRSAVMTEVQRLQRLRHQHIIQLVGTYTQGNTFAMLLYPVAEYNMKTFLQHCDFGRVEVELSYEQGRCWAALKRFFVCLLQALDYIHTEKLSHGDIKPPNILVRGPLPRLAYQVYICDFSISTRSKSQGGGQTDSYTANSFTYCAPEAANSGSRHRPGDVFSLGCVFLEMCTILSGKSVDEFTDFRRSGSGDTKDEPFYTNLVQVQEWIGVLCATLASASIPKGVMDATRRMLQLNPTERPLASDLLLAIPSKEWQCCLREREPLETCYSCDPDVASARDLAYEVHERSIAVGLYSKANTRITELHRLLDYITLEASDPCSLLDISKGTCRYADIHDLIVPCMDILRRVNSLLAHSRGSSSDAEQLDDLESRLMEYKWRLQDCIQDYDLALSKQLTRTLRGYLPFLAPLWVAQDRRATTWLTDPKGFPNHVWVEARGWLMLKGHSEPRIDYLKGYITFFLNKELQELAVRKYYHTPGPPPSYDDI
ncbi:hypothetical protein FGG08_003850 [Glutinoglossum americanum]|uniref:Protein kinase domain-containing protein n=1 Tax=Glutinoglossum americanum TaxID=1670608 RepID=A0A9P8L068_9PEZI|nr:hypothetical protein FGG08_003850 [Glutinoglossum americanum]